MTSFSLWSTREGSHERKEGLWEEDLYGWDPSKRRQPQTQMDAVMNQMAAHQM